MRLNLFTMLLPGCAALVGFTACTGAEAYERPDAPVKEVAFTQVHIDDSFWAPRIETNRKVSIPLPLMNVRRTDALIILQLQAV